MALRDAAAGAAGSGPDTPPDPALVAAPSGVPAPPGFSEPPAPGTSRLSGWTAQALLAAIGAGLLALAAVVFLAVTWDRLGAAGQAAVLLGVTVTAGTATRIVRTRGLPSTAEALGALTGILALVVVAAAWRAWFTPTDETAFLRHLAVSGALTAMALLAWARWARTATGEVAAVLVALGTGLVAPAALIATVGSERRLPWAGYPLLVAVLTIGLSGVATLLMHRSARVIGHLGLAGLAAVAGVGALIVAAEGPTAWGLSAAALLSAWLWVRGRPVGPATVAAALLVSNAGVVSAVRMVEGAPGARAMAAAVALVCAAVVAALPARRGAAAGGVAPVVAFATFAGAVGVLDGLASSLERVLAQPWRGTATTFVPHWGEAVAVTLGLLAACLLLWRSGARVSRAALGSLLAMALAAGLVSGVLVAGWGWAGQTAVGAAALVAGLVVRDRVAARGTGRLHVADLAIAAGAAWLLAWAVGNRWVTVAALAAVAAAAAHVARRQPGGEGIAGIPGAVAIAAGVGLPAVVAAALTWPGATTGAVAITGACTVAAAGVLTARRPRVLGVALSGVHVILGLVAAACLTAAWSWSWSFDPLWFVGQEGRRLVLPAVAYVLATGTAATALLAGRLWMVHLAAAVSALGTGALLADLDVGAPELYALTPAVITGALGLWRMARDPAVTSVVALRVPLALLLAPTALQVLDDPVDGPRVLALAIAAVVLGSLGIVLRWAALVLAGAACGVVLLLTQAWVAAGAVPRWVVFAVSGLLLVVASATYERQLGRLRQARTQLAELR